MKVKTFTEQNLYSLQELINEWIAEQRAMIEIVDVKYAAVVLPFTSYSVSIEYSALVLYQSL